MELRPAELLKEWQAGKFRPVYYFFGEESAAKADAVLKLKELFKADDFNLREFSGEPNSEAPAAVAEALTLPVFSDKRLVIVRSPKLPAEARAIYADYLKSPSPSTTLVLLSEDRRPDKKDALAGAASAAGAACIFSPLTDEEAISRLTAEAKKAGKTLTQEAAEALVGEAGTDWGILAGELEKLVLFAGAGAELGAAAALQCLGYTSPPTRGRWRNWPRAATSRPASSSCASPSPTPSPRKSCSAPWPRSAAGSSSN